MTKHLFFVGLSFLLSFTSARAHDPFDQSIRMGVFEDHVEVAVTLGYDAGREIMKKAGVRVRRDPTTTLTTDFPAEAAEHLLELKSGDARLQAKAFQGRPDDDGFLFTASYPRPAEGPLNVRAVYLDYVENIRQGVFSAIDAYRKPLGSALLSREQTSAQITVPPVSPRDPQEPSAAETSAPAPQSSADAPQAPATPPSDVAAPAAAGATPPVPAPVPRPSFRQYFHLGVEHILEGFDHLLFLGALLIGMRQVKPMLVIITCFTLAHSVTLALAALELVQISPRLVEPLIALSIIVVGVENLLRKDATSDRYWMAGGFGLIHGFGFAGVLRDTGLAQAGSIAMPLFAFNLGVEAGQLLVAAVVVPILLLLRRTAAFERYGRPAVSVLVILISTYWLLERTVL